MRYEFILPRRHLFVCLSACLSVCLFGCPQHNSKTNDPKVFELGIGNDIGYPRNDVIWGWKAKSQGHVVNKCIFTLMSITPMLMHICDWQKQYGVGSNSMSAFCFFCLYAIFLFRWTAFVTCISDVFDKKIKGLIIELVCCDRWAVASLNWFAICRVAYSVDCIHISVLPIKYNITI